MADESDTYWVVVAHKRLPFPSDDVIGNYATQQDAMDAFEGVMRNRQFFTEYSVERRLRVGPSDGVRLAKTWSQD